MDVVQPGEVGCVVGDAGFPIVHPDPASGASGKLIDRNRRAPVKFPEPFPESPPGFVRGACQEVIMIGEDHPGFEGPSERRAGLQKAIPHGIQDFRSVEELLTVVGRGGDEIGAGFICPVRGRMRPRRWIFAVGH